MAKTETVYTIQWRTGERRGTVDRRVALAAMRRIGREVVSVEADVRAKEATR